MTDQSLPAFRTAIINAFPELASSRFTIAGAGWHAVAVDVDGRLIFKFPRHDAAKEALQREAALLAALGPRLHMRVPDLAILPGPPLFSRHEKLQGGHLLAAGYEALPEDARARLAQDLARFYAELHAIENDLMIRSGARPIAAWQSVKNIREKALPLLSSRLRARAEEVLRRFQLLPPDPHGLTYGFFDGHGWNMAFDFKRRKLNGIYDFADSGIGPLHQDFIYASLVSFDLSERIVRAYEALTGRMLDSPRIALLSGMHRLSELAELAADKDNAAMALEHVRLWAEAEI